MPKFSLDPDHALRILVACAKRHNWDESITDACGVEWQGGSPGYKLAGPMIKEAIDMAEHLLAGGTLE